MGQQSMDQNKITQILPHRPPFLLVDRILSSDEPDHLRALLFLAPEMVFFQGHFPGSPIMPGVLVIEALAQTCGLLIGLRVKADKQEGQPRYVLARSEIKFVESAYPGESLLLSARLTKKFGALFRFDVEASVEDRTIASGSLSLARKTLYYKDL